MRLSHFCGLLALTLVVSACSAPGLTEQDVEDLEEELAREIRSVAGEWTGTSTVLTLDFQLKETAGSAVSGSGTMKETAATEPIPITVTGTFQRPQLSLTFHGMIVEGRPVEGTFQGGYISIGGIAAPLRLTAEGYSRDLSILLQER